MKTKFDADIHTNKSLPGCANYAMGCIFFILILVALLCAFFSIYLPRVAKAAGLTGSPLSVILLIDNSNSLFDKSGVGTDPALLRIDAARLFLSYLGVDDPDSRHEAGVIFFGSEAETAVPLTPLASSKQRTALFSRIANPGRMGWTDHLAALRLAQEHLAGQPEDARLVIIMLTDGRSEWSDSPTPQEQEMYLADLRALGQELAAQEISLYVIQLASDITDADAEIELVWQPLWQELSAATPHGAFFEARTAVDLPDIYHDIVVALTNRDSVGTVLDTAVSNTSQYQLEIPPNLDQITLVIRKASPTQTLTLQTNGGQSITTNHPQLRRAGDETSWEEVWVIDDPIPGTWTARFSQDGPTTIWLDYIPATLPTPLPASIEIVYPTATNQGQLPATATAEATATFDEMAAPITTSPPPADVSTTESGGAPWMWSIAPVLLLIVLGISFFLYHRSQQPQPTVAGTLKLLHGIQTDGGQSSVELDGFNRAVITMGKAPADIPLAGAAGQAIIRPGAAIGDVYEMLISGVGAIQLDKLPVFHETPLTDTAVIDFGNGIQARYENLRLRRALQESLMQTGQPVIGEMEI